MSISFYLVVLMFLLQSLLNTLIILNIFSDLIKNKNSSAFNTLRNFYKLDIYYLIYQLMNIV
jgi:hypothetical protein